MPGIPSALASLGMGHSGMAAAAAAASRLGMAGLAAAGGHNVLLVSNLNPEVSAPTLCVTVESCVHKVFQLLSSRETSLGPSVIVIRQVQLPRLKAGDASIFTKLATFLTCHFARCEFYVYSKN